MTSFRDTQSANLTLGQIDREKELILNPWKGFSYTGKVSLKSLSDPGEVFKLLSGRDSLGAIRAELKSEGPNELVLNLRDQKGAIETRIKVLDIGDEFEGTSVAFKSVRVMNWAGFEGVGKFWVNSGQGAVDFGYFLGPDQIHYSVVIERNTGGLGSPIRLKFFQGGRTRDLFFAVGL